MLYKYETHLHTCEASACGISRGAEYISVYKKLGYDGIFVTDHFFGGNTAVSSELDWEERIDDDTADLSDFLVKLTNSGLTDRQSLVVKNLMYTIIDLERIGDHAENMADYAKKMQEHKLSFSPQGMADLLAMKDAVMGSLTNALEARTDGDLEKVQKTLEFEEKVDFYEDQLRENHVERLSRGECQSEAGVIYLNLVTNLERVSDHAVNMVGYVKSEADDRTRLRKEQTA